MTSKVNFNNVLVLVTVALLAVSRVHSSKEIVKNMTASFSKALEECKKELGLPESIMKDFYDFWREEFVLVHRELGCAVMCMAAKFDMITDDMKLHRGNAHEFAKQHGADDDVAKQLVTIIHECEDKVAQVQYNDDCVKVLEIAKCFKTRMHELKWAPTMEVVLEEVMSEV